MITNELIAARAVANSQAEARQQLESEQAAAQAAERAIWQAAQQRYIETVQTARAGLKVLEPGYQRRDELARQAGALLSEMAVLNKELAERQSRAIEPVAQAGRPMGIHPATMAKDLGVDERPHQHTDIQVADLETAWAALSIVLQTQGHLSVGKNGKAWIATVLVGGSQSTYTL